MSQVLKYNMPEIAKLYCDNPVCQEYADFILHFDSSKESCSCLSHIDQLSAGKTITRLEKLIVAGERNHQDDA